MVKEEEGGKDGWQEKVAGFGRKWPFVRLCERDSAEGRGAGNVGCRKKEPMTLSEI